MELDGSTVVKMSRKSCDSFGRLRISTPHSQFSYQNQYDVGPLVWENAVVGTGSATHAPTSATVLLSTGGTASGASVIRQTRQYFRYDPGKSLQCLMTFTFGAAVANVRKRVGYFDGSNGIFLQQDSTGLSIGFRSSGSGSVVDTIVAQSEWSQDKLDGTTPSKVTIDSTKSQILMIDLQWLGAGSIRVAFSIDGEIYPAHQFHYANRGALTYMPTANLPLRYEITNTAATSGAGTMSALCATVMTEDGGQSTQEAYAVGASNGITAISVTARRPVLSIRPKVTFNSITNRSRIEIEDLSILVGGNNVFYELVFNGTLTGASFKSAGANSVMEFDVAASAITGGTVFGPGYAPAGVGHDRRVIGADVSARYPLTLDIAGTVPSILSVVATSFTGTATVMAALNWKEFY